MKTKRTWTRSGIANDGSALNPEQVEFGLACTDEQRRLGRNLTAAEILDVARLLGYRKEPPRADQRR